MIKKLTFETHHAVAANKQLQPSQALVEGLKHCRFTGLAADLGCGAGIDTYYLLNEGWKVLAIDSDESVLKNLQHAGIYTSCQKFEKLTLPPVQLVNASFALPFCAPEHFAQCWKVIKQSIIPGGIFCGHFFGVKDSWAPRKDMTFHTWSDYQDLFDGFDILWQTEIERDGKTLGGALKRWHVYHVTARAPINYIDIY